MRPIVHACVQGMAPAARPPRAAWSLTDVSERIPVQGPKYSTGMVPRYNLTYMHVPVGMFQACGHAGNKACLPYVICTYDLSTGASMDQKPSLLSLQATGSEWEGKHG